MAAKRLGVSRALAFLFVASVATYSFLWIWQTRSGVPGIGVPEMVYQPKTASLAQTSQVVSGSVADVAGLRQRDHIVSIQGIPLRDLVSVYDGLVLQRFDVLDLPRQALLTLTVVADPMHHTA